MSSETLGSRYFYEFFELQTFRETLFFNKNWSWFIQEVITAKQGAKKVVSSWERENWIENFLWRFLHAFAA